MKTAVTIDDNGIGRLGIQLLLTAEVMLFSGLVAAFLVLKSGNPSLFHLSSRMLYGWTYGAVIALALGSVILFHVARDETIPSKNVASKLGIAMLLAATYFAMMAMQWNELDGPRDGVFFSCYYLITGAVACHVLATAIAALDLAVRIRRGTLALERLHCIAMLWHFATVASVLTTILLHWA